AYDDAHAEYWNSLVIWPDRWSTHYNQGIYHDRKSEPEMALAAYNKSMELRDDVIQPMINAAMVHARSGNSTNAYDLLRKALNIEPESPMVNFNLALLEAEFKHLDKAEQYLRAALDADPRMAQAAYNLGVLLCRNNDSEGFQWLETAAGEVPENWNYTSSYIFFLQQAGKTSEVEPLLMSMVDTGRAAPETYFTLADRFQRTGRISEAIEIYRKARLDKRLPMDAKRYADQMEQRLRAMN
ncbi:MAG: tetratricopeptide repeat protein, partial [Kiritimatiellales bacterium]|nr:tetratricopeptide repeat protein [Kiritimatiellales bacterium]